jgi:hypothetical protein
MSAMTSMAFVHGINASNKRNGNMLGDSSVWLQFMQFIDFGDLKISERQMQISYPPLYSMYVAIMSQQMKTTQNLGSTQPLKLNFSDACKLLLLNNVEGLSSRNVMELYTSAQLNQNTYVLCSNIVSMLADERHSSSVYEEAFKYILSKEGELIVTVFTSVI